MGDNSKTTSPVKNALGINTCSVKHQYAQAYPWLTTTVTRTPGWHSLAFYHNGETLTMVVDDQVASETMGESAHLKNVLIHGGLDAETTDEQPSYWDAIFVTPLIGATLELHDDVEPTSYKPHVEWTQMPSGPPARQGHSAVAYGESFYVYGGERSAYEYSDIWKFNTTAEEWSFVSPLNDTAPPRHDHTAVVYGDAMYVYGGRSPVPLGDFWKFSFADGTWEEMPMSAGMHPRFGHSAVVIDGKMPCMMVYGGYAPAAGGLSQELWSFDFATHEWTLVGPRSFDFDEFGSTPYVADPSDAIMFPADIPNARFSHVAVAKGDRMYVYGGAGGVTMKAAMDDCWYYDCIAKTWTPVYPHTSLPRYDSAAGVIGPYMVVFGGHGATGFLNDLQIIFAQHAGM